MNPTGAHDICLTGSINRKRECGGCGSGRIGRRPVKLAGAKTLTHQVILTNNAYIRDMNLES